MTVDTLSSYSVKDLAQLAKKHGVQGWHSMRKDQLVSALAALTSKKRAKRPAQSAKRSTHARRPQPASLAPSRTTAASRPSSRRKAKPAKAVAAPKAVAKSAAKTPPVVKSTPPVKAPAPAKPAQIAKPAAKTAPELNTPRISPKAWPRTKGEERSRQEISRVKDEMARIKNLAYRDVPGQPQGFAKDRLVVMVRDPYWLHAYWELSRHGVQRAEAALAQQWHTAKPVLRLFEVSNHGLSTASETLVRTISIHGGVNNWYLDVQDPPKSYRLDIGYLSSEGKFFMLARSNIVHTPRAGVSDSIDNNWTDVAEQYERVLAMNGGYSPEGPCSELKELFEERLRRPMNTPLMRTFALAPGQRKKEFNFTIDAELIIYGSTEADARVTLQGDPVQLRPDGTFTVRFALPDCRQIIPAVASSSDGLEQRTIVVAVERNTKVMEPVLKENDE